MGLDRNNIPDEYLCEICKPRPIDRKRAKALQARKRNELFKDSSSDEGSGTPSGKKRKVVGSAKKILDRKAEAQSKASGKAKKVGKGEATPKGGKANKLDKNRKQVRNRKPSEKGTDKKGSKRFARRKSQNDDLVDADDDDDEDILMEPSLDASQQLRSWIDQYEEAVTNHYSPELRARLTGNKLNGVSTDLRPSVIGAPVKCNVSLKGNGVKILTASTNVSTNTPIIECKGKLMLASQYRASTSKSSPKPSHPYIFFYHLSDNLEICLDGKTYGNDSRFCRRSNDHNAELRHVIDKGSLHLFIVAKKVMEKNQEILLPPMTAGRGDLGSPLQSISADLREMKKSNGIMSGSSAASSPSQSEETGKSAKKKQKVTKKIKRTPSKNANEKKKPKPAKLSTDEEEEEESPGSDSGNEVNGEQDESKKDSSPGKVKQSPGKLGLPDSSGLIVGVNTINYDASSSLKNKAKSREERKMEMIMKAIEAMEKAEQRKKEQSDGGRGGGEDRSGSTSKRRRSSTNKNSHSTDSALDASSADEGKPEPKRNNKKKGGRKSGPTTPQRRRSRVMSGGSASAVSENEATPGGDTGGSSNGPFRFPKTKKMLMSDWYQESEGGGVDEEDDVSGNYLRGSRSPPGIATHLLRSTPHSPVKSFSSAKKRWLRQAISEDHSEDVVQVMTNGSSPPVLANADSGAEVNVDYVTPLKKRRLANYKDDTEVVEEEGQEGEKVPSGLKKKLLHNLVLEAVLDKAMEDMLGGESQEAVEEEEAMETESESKATAKKPLADEKTALRKKTSTSTTTPVVAEKPSIRTPEPSSVFKSYFKSDVSLEQLEAELEATKRQREAAEVEVKNENNSEDPTKFSLSCDKTANDTSDLAKKAEMTQEVDATNTDSKIPEKKEAVPESAQQTNTTETLVPKSTDDSLQTPVSATSSAKAEPVLPKEEKTKDDRPKEKRRVSLADYKRRRKVDLSLTASGNSEGPKSAGTGDGIGTPTLDEQALTAPPTLSTLPLFEKLEKLEKAQKETRKKGKISIGRFCGASHNCSFFYCPL